MSAKREATKADAADQIEALVQELKKFGLALGSTSGHAQSAALSKVLAYLGPRGLGTFEGVAAGYSRLAARINDLRAAGWRITSRRENLVGPDGLHHRGVARYFLMGRQEAQKEAGDADI